MRKDLKVVLDTNVIISAVIGKSPTFTKIYDAFVNSLFTPVLSAGLQEEIFNVVRKPRLRRYFHSKEISRFNELLKIDALWVTPGSSIALCRDAKDNLLLETAVAAKADFLVTGDNDLLVLASCFSIPIINPRQFSEILANR